MKLKRIIKIILGILVGYTALYFLVRLFFKLILVKKEVVIQTYQNSIALHFLPTFFISFLIISTVVIYLFNSWLEGKWIPLKWSQIFLYMGTFAGAGPTGEIVLNSLSRFFVHHPIWMYQFLPIHGGDTSVVMAVIWPIYGFHMYCFHTALKAKHDKTTDFDMSIFVGIDAITLEVFCNMFSIFFFYTYIFYYLAGDLNHLSTIFIFVPYIVCGYIVIKNLHFIEKKHYHTLFGIFGFLWGWLILFFFR